MTDIPHILSPMATPWTSWVMLLIPICGILAEVFRSGGVAQSFASVFSTSERTYNDSSQNILSQIWMYIFRVAVVAMALYLLVHGEGTFALVHYLIVLAVVTGWDVVRRLLSGIVDYTFGISRHFAPVFAHYDNIWTVGCCCIYPLLLVLLRVDNSNVTAGVVLGMFCILVLLMLVKWIRVFFVGLRSLLYIALYVVTLEILPAFGIIVGLSRVV